LGRRKRDILLLTKPWEKTKKRHQDNVLDRGKADKPMRENMGKMPGPFCGPEMIIRKKTRRNLILS